MTAPHLWKKLGPLAYACRERHPSNPRWADLEYLVFNSANKPPFNAKRYGSAFAARIQLDRAFQAWQLEIEDALAKTECARGKAL